MSTGPERLTSLPNLLSLLRLLLAPLMLAAAITGWREAFLALLCLAWISDGLDGFLARRLHQVSRLGSRLDTLGDFVVYAVLPVGLYLLWPGLILQEIVYIAAGILAYLAAHLFALIKFRQLAGYHMWSAKFSAALIGLTLLLMLGWDLHWPFRLAVGVLLLACLESILITLKLRRFRNDIPSLFLLRAREDGEN